MAISFGDASKYDGRSVADDSGAFVGRISGSNRDKSMTSEPDEEIFHIQADGFWGLEKGFHDVEQLRKQ